MKPTHPYRRAARTILTGVLGGFVVAALYSFAVAQSYPELDRTAVLSLPESPSLNEMFTAIAAAAGVSYVSTGITADTSVGVLVTGNGGVNIGRLFDSIVAVNNLCSGLREGVLIVYRAQSGCDDRLSDGPRVVPGSDRDFVPDSLFQSADNPEPDLLGLDASVTGGGFGPARITPQFDLPSQPSDESPKVLGFRFRVMQIDDSRAARLGIDWRALLTTSNALAVSVPPVLAGFMASPDLDGFVSALESQGVATRLEDMRLSGVEGEPVSFNRGGTININLVGGGDSTVSKSFQFGLGFTVTAFHLPSGLRVLYTFDDSSPSNVTDATNVQISSTSNQSSTVLECGASTLLAALSTERFSHDGNGLPGVSRVPVLGYAAGQANDDQRRSMIAVTLEVTCG